MGGATGRGPSCPPRLNPVCHLTAAETEAERQSSPGDTRGAGAVGGAPMWLAAPVSPQPRGQQCCPCRPLSAHGSHSHPQPRGQQRHPCRLLSAHGSSCVPPAQGRQLSLQAAFCPQQLPVSAQPRGRRGPCRPLSAHGSYPIPSPGGGSIVPAGCFLPMASGLTSARKRPRGSRVALPSLAEAQGCGTVGWGTRLAVPDAWPGFQGQSWGLQGQASLPC